MTLNKYILIASVITVFGSCNLDEHLKGTVPPSNGGGGSVSAQTLLNGAYNDLAGPFCNGQDLIFSLEENVTDECLVPTRGGDWDDNGVWRVLHAHAWDATHGQAISVFNSLGTIENDATTVLAFDPTPEQANEAIFLRSLAQFYYLDLYGQVPYRTVENYNSIDASPVMQPADAIDTIKTNLENIINSSNFAEGENGKSFPANKDAARFLLMKLLLNKQAFLNRQAPADADPSDMQEVISMGNEIMKHGYNFTTHYFDNFGPNNAGNAAGYGYGVSTESIFASPNNGSSNNNGINSFGIDTRWMMALHYNSWDQVAPNAGWNGFSTVGEFYKAFDENDTRRGNVAYPGVTDVSGLRVGLDEGQQYDKNGKEITDRKGHPLVFADDVSLVETNPATLEGDGIRVIKYPPDYANYSSGNQRNQFVFFRYADVVLMIAEAQLRTGDAGSALVNVNKLRAARGASPLTTVSLVNTSNLYDGSSLLAERQKELYWESWRRQDLIRFGVFLQPWALKTSDDPKYLLFAIPTAQLIANPNLTQNPGY